MSGSRSKEHYELFRKGGFVRNKIEFDQISDQEYTQILNLMAEVESTSFVSEDDKTLDQLTLGYKKVGEETLQEKIASLKKSKGKDARVTRNVGDFSDEGKHLAKQLIDSHDLEVRNLANLGLSRLSALE